MKFASPTSRSRFRFRFAWFDVFWAVAAPVIAVALRDPALLIGERSDLTSPVYIFVFVAAGAALLSLIVFRLSDGMSHMFTVHDLLAVGGAVGLSVAVTSVIMFTFTRLDGVPRFSSDGTRVLTASADSTARLWTSIISIDELTARVRQRVPRQLTPAERQRFYLP